MSLRVEGLDNVRAALLDGRDDAAGGILAQRLGPKVKLLMLGGLRRAFDKQGPGWRSLKPATLRAKRKRGQPTKIGEATGTLKASFSRDGAAMQSFTASASGFSLRSDVPYASHFSRDREIRLPPEAEAEIRTLITNTILDTLGRRR